MTSSTPPIRDPRRSPSTVSYSTFPSGFHYLPEFFNPGAQMALMSDIDTILFSAPLFQQTIPRPVELGRARHVSSITASKGLVAAPCTAGRDGILRRRSRQPHVAPDWQ
jgi:hypothetical protein